MKLIAAALGIALLATNVYAESKPLESYDPSEMLKAAQKNEEDSLWAVRILNTQAISNYHAADEAGKWCGARGSSESKDPNADACAFYVRLAKPAEEAIEASITMTQKVVSHLKGQPRSKQNAEHLQKLEEQLKILKNSPSRVNDFFRAKLLKQ